LKFNLIDKVESLTDSRIVAIKTVTLAEEYLADHFPTFPVLPGVLMLEAATQAAGWLLHHRRGFGASMVVLKDARNLKYGNFVAPGNILRITAEWSKDTDSGASFKVAGEVFGPLDGAAGVAPRAAFGGRVDVAYFNLGDKDPLLAAVDGRLLDHTRRRWALIAPATTPAALELAK
jgi:3-hydroxyacyl-[acyl-carrier-protein] dehydratase